MTIKLTGHVRLLLQQANRRRNDTLLKAELEQRVATLVGAVDQRLRAEWGSLEKQADMRVMAKYRHAAPVKGANLTVYCREKKRWDERFGVSHAWPDIFIPSRGGGYYAGQDPGEYFDCRAGEGEPDYEALYEVCVWRRERQDQIHSQQETFYREIRTTSSYAKILEAHPWLASEVRGV